ncbi:MAG: CapA family protein [Oscillospiraceae bacterium]|nr:CapA family protein [Oscillospiraceae bacterium]
MKKTILLFAVIAAGLALIGAVALRIVTPAAVYIPPEPSASPTPAPTPSPTPSPTPAPTPSPTPESSPPPTPEPEPQPEYFTLSFVGDCTIGSSQHQRGSSASFEGLVGNDYTWPFAATKQYFEDDYLSMANMEGTFTTAEISNGNTFTFKADPSYAAVFPEGSIEFVTLANNHAGDYLDQGLRDTEAALEAAGVGWAADGGVWLYESDDGPSVGVYAKLYPSVAEVHAGVYALREQGAEIIIAALHWGLEGVYRPIPDQEAVGHAAIDAGADIVWGCHPHVLQRVEEYGGGMIFYSLGNWSFGGNTAPRDRDTAIAKVTVKRDVDGSLSKDSWEVIPCSLSGVAGVNNYQPTPYAPESEDYARAMSKLDGSFSGPDLVVDYSAFHPNPSEETEEAGETEPPEEDHPESSEDPASPPKEEPPSDEAGESETPIIEQAPVPDAQQNDETESLPSAEPEIPG